MREKRPSDSEGGGAPIPLSLPLSLNSLKTETRDPPPGSVENRRKTNAFAVAGGVARSPRIAQLFAQGSCQGLSADHAAELLFGPPAIRDRLRLAPAPTHVARYCLIGVGIKSSKTIRVAIRTQRSTMLASTVPEFSQGAGHATC